MHRVRSLTAGTPFGLRKSDIRWRERPLERTERAVWFRALLPKVTSRRWIDRQSRYYLRATAPGVPQFLRGRRAATRGRYTRSLRRFASAPDQARRPR